jgi:uncharacterized membrane protein
VAGETKEVLVTLGVILVMMGAILTFALKNDSSVVDLQILGIILMVGGGALMFHAQQTKNKVREVTEIKDLTNPEKPTHIRREEILEDDPYEGPAEDHAST